MSFKVSLLFVIVGVVALTVGAPESRIVNGDDAESGQIPYQGQLFIAGTPTCGATILSANFVLTLSQCVCSLGSNNPWPPQLFSIRAGTTDLYTGGVSVRVAEITVNQVYSELRTNLAVLRLETPLVLSSQIQPIEVARENPPAGAVVDISGFGRLKITDEYLYRTLQYYEETVLDQDVCEQKIQKEDETVICLTHPRKFGICSGDFGGPAVYEDQLVGVAAYLLAEECGTSEPDVYISAAYYRDWIVGVISN